MMRKMVIEGEESVSDLCFEAMVYVDRRYAYGSRVDTNMLCKIDMISGECEYVALFPSENTCGKRLHIKAAKYKEHIVFSPSVANNICIYNYVHNEFILIELDACKARNKNVTLKYADIVMNGQYCYLIPATYSQIIKIDMEKKEVVDRFCISTDVKYNFRKDGVVVGDKYYISSANSNLVLELDMAQDVVKTHRVGKYNNGSWGMCYSDEVFWIIPYLAGAIVKWNPKTGEIKENLECYKVISDEEYMFMRGILIGTKIYAIPYYSKHLLVFDTKTEKMEWIYINSDTGIEANVYLGSYEGDVYFLGSSKKIGWIDENLKRCFRWCIETNEIEECTFKIKMNKMEYLGECFGCESGIVKENEVVLQDFLEYIKGE